MKLGGASSTGVRVCFSCLGNSMGASPANSSVLPGTPSPGFLFAAALTIDITKGLQGLPQPCSLLRSLPVGLDSIPRLAPSAKQDRPSTLRDLGVNVAPPSGSGYLF